MLRRRLEPPRDPMPNMTAMVDLVMCILIFFMLGSTFAPDLYGLTTPTPKDVGISTGGPSPADDLPLPITVRSGGTGLSVTIPVEGRSLTVRLADDEIRAAGPVRRDALARLSGELAARRAALGGKVRLVLRPERAAEYRHIAVVLEAGRDAGFAEIAFGAAE